MSELLPVAIMGLLVTIAGAYFVAKERRASKRAHEREAHTPPTTTR
jgi:hypothetical protein